MVSIGADPELFVLEPGRPRVLPMCGVLKGTKDAPYNMGDGYAVQWDNVMLEYNIPPVIASDTPWFTPHSVSVIQRIITGARRALQHAEACTGQKGLRYATSASASLSREMLERKFGQLPFTFGCSPEFSVGTKGEKVTPLSGDSSFWVDPENATRTRRFAGGHIHLGYSNPDNVPKWVVAGLCDHFVLPVALAFGDGGGRRDYYGQPGRFRPTEYGIEYRSPSADWVAYAVTGKPSRHRTSRNGEMPSPAEVINGAGMVGNLVEAVPAEMLAVGFRALQDLFKRTGRRDVSPLGYMLDAVSKKYDSEVANIIYDGVLYHNITAQVVRERINEHMGWEE